MTEPSLALTAGLVFAAFAAGAVDAIGGGGGLVTLPVLLACGLDPKIALATNKGQAVFGAISSAVSYSRRGVVDRERAPTAFVAGLVGSACGALLLTMTRPEPLRPVVVVLLLCALATALVPRDKLPRYTPKHPTLALVSMAFGLGAYDGFFGPGVGSMLIAANVIFFGDSLVEASGNAKIVNLASNLAAFTIFAIQGKILFRLSIPMAVANAAGANVGARLAIRGGDKLVRKVLVVVVLAVVAKLVRDILR
jgi:hypothetical protein